VEDHSADRRRAIATRVRYWTDRRGMTRDVFAGRIGRSVSWVDKIRSGDRVLDRLSVLEQIADVLDVSLHVLIDDEQSARAAECVDAAEVASIRDALQRYDVITNVFRPAAPELPDPDVHRLSQGVLYAWLAFQTSDYSALGPILGRLITEAQYAHTELVGDEQRQATELLAQTYQLATSTLRKLGHFQLEWIAAERGVIIAEHTENPVLIGGAAFRLVNALRDSDAAGSAVRTAIAGVNSLQPVLDTPVPENLSLWGNLMLQGAMAAATQHNPSAARDLLNQAEGVAARLGGDRNDYWTSFGPTNVNIHRVAAAVELREWGTAIDTALNMPPVDLGNLPKERRANHLVDLARAYSLAARTDDAVRTLSEADALAQKEVRCRPLARDVITDLWRRSHTPSWELRQLAEKIGLAA
jgi:transcriptional regulator with XRE-family HTH domain